jgi:hypothetical protein
MLVGVAIHALLGQCWAPLDSRRCRSLPLWRLLASSLFQASCLKPERGLLQFSSPAKIVSKIRTARCGAGAIRWLALDSVHEVVSLIRCYRKPGRRKVPCSNRRLMVVCAMSRVAKTHGRQKTIVPDESKQ